MTAAAQNDGATPVWAASQNGHLEVVGLLVEKGADVNQAKTVSEPARPRPRSHAPGPAPRCVPEWWRMLRRCGGLAAVRLGPAHAAVFPSAVVRGGAGRWPWRLQLARAVMPAVGAWLSCWVPDNFAHLQQVGRPECAGVPCLGVFA